MRKPVLLVAAALLALAGCGGDDSTAYESPPQDRAARTSEEKAATTDARPAAARRRGKKITLRDSEFGSMLFDSRRQAIYVFQRDRRNRSNCYGECAEAWPPVYTTGTPVAGRGVRRSLLGSIRRRGGRRQVTYAGKPLYFYAHEGPGEVRCHNVNLNGGLWWVVGPNGKRRP